MEKEDVYTLTAGPEKQMLSGRELIPTGRKSQHHNPEKAREFTLKDKGHEILAYKPREFELPALKGSVEFITRGRQVGAGHRPGRK